jgi:DNA-binding MarR family transcriptional regulator
MDSPQFADEFGRLYREVYRVAVRRIADGREALSVETTALLSHLAQAGPMSLTEMSLHFDRALSTLSAKVAALEADGLLARQRDDIDARRATIWLSPHGRQVLTEALDVLDRQRVSTAAERLTAKQRSQLIAGLHALTTALTTAASSHDPAPERSPHDTRL